MRTAKASGDGSLLLPKGCNIQDVPADLMVAVNHAYTILSWHEGNLAPDEIPKRWMWHLDWELDKWFDKVDRQREIKYGTKNEDVAADSDFERNELFEDFIGGED